MKKSFVKKLLSAVLCMAMVMTLLAGCSKSNEGGDGTTTTAPTAAPTSTDNTATQAPVSNDEGNQADNQNTDKPAETVVIRYGSHWIPELDPNNVDDVTGEYTMAEDRRQAALAGLQAIKDELNVEFEFVQYAQDTRVELMTSVLAGDPVCDIATLWGGSEATVLAQNILQPIDKYASIFDDDETSWMLDPQVYGHNYLLSFTERFIPRWPLVYNVNMVADAGLEDPAKVYLAGNWTWSTFKTYLETLNAFYANTPATEGHYDTVKAYVSDHRFVGLSAMYSNGGAIYGDTGVEADTDKTIEALNYVRSLYDEGLACNPGVYDDGYTPRWCEGADDFQKGNTVFTDCPDWWLGGNGDKLAERNQSQGIVPWPRADRLSADSDEYGLAMTLGDSVGILKGISEEKTELAVKAYRLYWLTFYKTLAGVDDLSQYTTVMGQTEAKNCGFDIFNETYGKDILAAFVAVSQNLKGDLSDMLGYRVVWDDIFGKSMYGIDGFSSDYSVAVAANKSNFDNINDNMVALLSSDEVHDNQAPEISASDCIVPLGTDLTAIDRNLYWTAKDSVDGELDANKGEMTISDGSRDDEDAPDTNTVGEYRKALKLVVSDKAGNTNSARAKVIVFNPNNTTAPTVTVKAELPTVKMDTDASTINWSDFIESATDADGLDVKGNVSADLSTLDASTPGDYSVALTVTDYAGNTTAVTVAVKVAAE